jgi:hypothetical protein
MIFITTDELELGRLLIAVALVLVNVAVWLGVYLEGDRLSESTKRIGWKVLVTSLAAEAAFAAMLVAVDSVISIRQKAEIVALERAISPRRLYSDDLIKFVAATKSFAGRSVSVWSYARDVEAEILAGQIIQGLESAQISVINRVGAMISSTTARVGVRLTGPDGELIAALTIGLKPLSPVRDPYKPEPGVSVPAAEIFVGIKPIATVK